MCSEHDPYGSVLGTSVGHMEWTPSQLLENDGWTTNIDKEGRKGNNIP